MSFQARDDERKVDGRVIMNGDGRATVTLPKKETQRIFERFWHMPFSEVVNSEVTVTASPKGIMILISPPEKRG